MPNPVQPAKHGQPTYRETEALSFVKRLWPRGNTPHAKRQRPFVRLMVECLEDRTLLSGSVFGNVYEQLAGGVTAPVANQVVYLDLNGNGKLDSSTVSLPGIPTLGASTGTSLDPVLPLVGGVGAALEVQDLPTTFQDVSLELNITNNNPANDPNGAAVLVNLISPLGLTIPNLPTLFTLQPGQTFNGFIDGDATTPITLAPNINQAGSTVTGTFAPQQSFSNPSLGIGNSVTDGTWGLVIYGGDTSGLTLNSWSLNFTVAEPSTTTDANGAYSFTDLAAGSYSVRLAIPATEVVTSPSNGIAAQSVTITNADVNGVDFGVQPAPVLSSVAFNLTAPATQWGQQITIDYTVTNEGAGASSAFDVGLYLSSTGTIGTSGPLLGTMLFAGLAAGASASQSVTETLPGTAPSGFDALSNSYVGAVIEPGSANIANAGAGVDLALLGTPVNTAVTTNTDVQQDPSIAVDPTNPEHLVTAYMDYSLVNTGYAGIGVSVSYDGGKTWSASSIPLPAGYAQGAAVPTVAFDNLGNVYVSFQATTYLRALPALTANLDSASIADGFTSNNGIFVATSTDGGRTFTANNVVPVTDNPYSGTPVPFAEFPSMAVDTYPKLPSGVPNPDYGSVYVTWTTFYPAGEFPGDPSSSGGSQLMFAISTDSGATFTTQMQDVAGTGPATGSVSALQDPSDASGGGTEYDGPGSFDKYTTVTTGPNDGVFITAYSGGNFIIFSSQDGGRSTDGQTVSGFVAPNYPAQTGFVTTENNFLLSDATLADDAFRTLKYRRIIVADPNQAGVLYAIGPNSLDESSAEGGPAVNASGVFFAVSDDYGESWSSNFTVGAESQSTLLASVPVNDLSEYAPVLNDELGGQFPAYGQSFLQNQPQQAMPSMTVDAQGDIVVIWYDTRATASGQDLEVWGTISRDGGRTFTANFPISNMSFNPGATAYLGDQIGVAAADGNVYAVWTDMRSGNQNIEFGGFSMTPAPAAPVDRFYPNQTEATATALGTVTTQQQFPDLALLPGADADEWFTFQAGSDGQLDVSISAADAGANMALALTDADGNPIPDAVITEGVDASGAAVEQLVASGVADATYFIHVSALSNTVTKYSLAVSDLTADLGQQVYGSVPGTLATGGEDVYRLQASVTGTLQLNVSATNIQSSGLELSIVSADGKTVLAASPSLYVNTITPNSPSAQYLLPVSVGQVVYIVVAAGDPNASADFTLTYTNYDEYETQGKEVEGAVSDAAPSGSYALDEITPAVSGNLQVSGQATGDYTGPVGFYLLDANFNVLAGPEQVTSGGDFQLNLSVTAGQVIYLLADGGGAFANEITNNGTADFTASLVIGQAASGFTQLFFPTVGDPTALAAVNLGNGTSDLVYTNTDTSDSLGVLTGTGKGTFWSDSQYAVGPGLASSNLTAGNRQFAVADLTGNGIPDVIVPNLRSDNVSVLLGNGDGTFQPQRTFDAVGAPGAVATGVFTASGNTDAIVLANFEQGVPSDFAFLAGNGDGTFQPPVLYSTVFQQGATGMVVGAFGNPNPGANQNNLDLVIYSKNSPYAQIFYGNGDGTFTNGGTFALGETTYNIAAADLTGDGRLDLVTTGTNSGNVYVMLGNGNGTFQAPTAYSAMVPVPGDQVGVFGLAVVDFTGDGIPDIIVTAQSRSGQGPAELIMLPGNGDGSFGASQVLATVGTAGNIVAGNFGNGAMDVAVADTGGITVVYGAPLTLKPITTPATGRNLGDAAHLISQPQAIVPGHTDAYFTYDVPIEVVPGAGDEVVDISALFQNTYGNGLSLSVTLPDGSAATVLESTGSSTTGQRIRVLVAQGTQLTILVSSNAGGYGVFTLDVDVLPQIVSAQAEAPLPGGALTSIVLTLQGDNLDPATANNPANYFVFPLNAAGVVSGPAVALASAPGSQAVVYAPGANIDVATGLTFPTAVRQTITLFLDQPLVAGASYLVVLAPAIEAEDLNADESADLVVGSGFTGHPLVGLPGGVYQQGGKITVQAIPQPGNLNQLTAGTPFLTQMHDDLSADLDTQLSGAGNNSNIPLVLTNEILSSFVPGWLAGGANTPFLILWLDPVSIQLADPGGNRATFNLQTNAVTNQLSQTFIEVGGTVEVMVIAALSGTYNLQVSDVQASARGEGILLDGGNVQTVALTNAMSNGVRDFQFSFPEAAVTSAVGSAFSTIGDSIVDFASSVTVQFTIAATQTVASLLTEAVVVETLTTIVLELPVSSNTQQDVNGPVWPGAVPFLQNFEVIPGVAPDMLFGPVVNTIPQLPAFRSIRNLFKPNRGGSLPNPENAPPIQPVAAVVADAEEALQAPPTAADPLELAEPIEIAAPVNEVVIQQAQRDGKLGGLLVGTLITVGAAYGFAFLQDDERKASDPRDRHS